MFLSQAAKLVAAVREIATRQAVLAGTGTVEAAEEVSRRMDDAGVVHELRTTRNHARERTSSRRRAVLGP